MMIALQYHVATAVVSAVSCKFMVKYCRELVTFFVTGSSGQWILALLRWWSNNYTCKKKYQKRETVKLWCWYVHMIMATGTYLVNAPSQVLRKGILIFYIQKRYCVVRNPLSWHFLSKRHSSDFFKRKHFNSYAAMIMYAIIVRSHLTIFWKYLAP